jgi:hypothetical protein
MDLAGEPHGTGTASGYPNPDFCTAKTKFNHFEIARISEGAERVRENGDFRAQYY